MGHHDVVRSQIGRHSLHHLEQRIIVGHENLDEIAELSDFGGRSDKIRHRAGRAAPDKNVESVFAQIVDDPLANNAKADDSNILSGAK
jgi:hypothetical protein